MIDLNKFIEILFENKTFNYEVFFDNLPMKFKQALLQQIADACNVSLTTVRGWRARGIPRWHKPSFAKAVGYKPYELFPEFA